MIQHEYEQNKRKCFNGFCKRYRIEEPSEQNIESFDWIFDHAYALGKQENDPEPKCLHFKDGKCAHPAVAHLENGKLVKGADCDVSSCEDVEYEPQPAEPKFKEGDRAIYCIPEKQRIKARVVNVRQRSGSTLFNTLFNYDIRLDDGRTANWVDEQWLLPDNDDQVRAVTEKASERFDKILAKDLRKEKRLRIAAQITASIYANHKAASRFHSIEALVRKALEIADTLIAECEKGGNQD